MDDPAARPRIPLTSLIFGYGPILPLPIAALLIWTLPDPWPATIGSLAIWWGASILIFLAGVRRGRSFDGDEETPFAKMAEMIWLFVLGALAIAVGSPLLALVLLALGYATIAILDPIAARHGDAPPHFAKLRPPQMSLALVGIVAMIVYCAAAPA